VTSTAASVLQERLGLTDDELLQVLDVDPLTLVAGDDLDHRPELPILLALTEDVDPAVLRRWLRANGGAPARLLLARDFAAFEDAVEDLRDRGLIIRASRHGPGPR
jgi:hypothetical protein